MRGRRPLLAAAIACCLLAPPGDAAASDDVAALLDAYLERWEAQGLSAAVLVARGDEVLLSEGYGLARRAAGIAVTPDTLFDIGSLSKQVTATAILALVEEGRLQLDRPVAAVLPAVSEDKASITLHQLLTHTSGVEDFDEGTQPIDRRGFLKRWAAQPVTDAPGSAFAYSNTGYTVLAAVVEEVTGETFEHFVRRRLFERAGLADTAFVWESAFPWPRTRAALGYGGFADACGGDDPVARGDSFMLRGSGGVVSTVTELFRWRRAIDRGAVLRPETRDLLLRPHTRAEADFLSYGYGWRIQRSPRGTRIVWHSGLEGAFNSIYRNYEDEGLTVVFLSNQSIDGVPMRDLLVRPAREGLIGNVLFGGTVALPPPAPRRLEAGGDPAGDWRGADGGLWRVASGGPGWRLRALNQQAVDTLFPPDDHAAAIHARAGARGRELAEAIARGDDDRLAKLAGSLDPYGYSGRRVEDIARDWRRSASDLGRFVGVEEVATTWTRHGPEQRTVTHLRIAYERGALDEKFLVWADDESYLVPCAPDGFEFGLAPLGDVGFVAFDPVSRRSWSVTLAPGPDRVLQAHEIGAK